jgi:hypothetical protein
VSGYCGVCGANLGQIAALAMHPEIGEGDVLCGPTGKRAHVTAAAPAPPEPDPTPQPTREEMRQELWRVIVQLEYHRQHEDTPVEVITESGWMDMVNLLDPLRRMLSA